MTTAEIIGFIAGAFTGSRAGRDAVPEPATLSLLALGGLAVIRRRRSGKGEGR